MRTKLPEEKPSQWEPVFAWIPRYCEGHRVWLERLERRLVGDWTDYDGYMDRLYEYRFPVKK